jgi:hypothetical protein
MDEIKVEEKYDLDGRPYLKVESSKFSAPFTVYKLPNGYVMYGIRADKGNVAKELSGSFTSMQGALNTLKEYIRKAKKTPTRRRTEHGDDYERRKKAKKNA